MEKLQITSARQLLLNTLKEYNSEVTQVYWFKFTNRETDLFVEMMEKYSNEQNIELLRRNMEMKEAVKEILNKATIQHTTIRDLLMHPETTDENQINKLQAMDRVLNNFKCDLADCLTSCNKGKE